MRSKTTLLQLVILRVLVSGTNPITNHCKGQTFTVMCSETSRSKMTKCLQSPHRNVSVTCKKGTLYISLNCLDKRRDSTHRCCDVSLGNGERTSNRIAKATCLVNFLPCEETSKLSSARELSCEWENSTLNISATSSQIMGVLCNQNKEKSVSTSELQACLETKSVNKTNERNETLTNRTTKRLVKTVTKGIQNLVKPYRNCTALSIQELSARIEDFVRPFLHNILVTTVTNTTFTSTFTSEVVDFYAVVTADLQNNLTVPDRTDQREPSGSITLSPSVIPLEHGNSKSKGPLGLVAVVFKFGNSCKNVPFIGKVSLSKETRPSLLESPVISVLAMTKQGVITKLKGNATLKFKIKKRPLSAECVFLNRTALPENAWSTVGMTNVNEPDENYTLCKTDHLTSFAVLIGYSSDTQKLSSTDKFALDLITKIGCAFALICLAACILTFVCVRSLSAMRYRIHLNLCIALSVAILLFVTGIEATRVKGICIAIAVMLHYFFTAAFTWMCVEAIHLFFKIVSVFHDRITRMRNYVVIGWGLPALIVVLSAAIHHEGYSTTEVCWLSSKRHFIWAFIAPVIVIILINVVVLVAVVFVRLSLKGNPLRPEDNQRFVGALKTVIILFPLLGLTWLFGFMGVITRKLPFLYVFAALSSLQGVFILLFQCIGNNEVRGSIKAIKERHSIKSSLRLEMENRQRENRSLHDCRNGTNAKRKGSKRYFRKLSVCRKSKRQRASEPSDV